MNHLKSSCPTTEKARKGANSSADRVSILLYFFLNLYHPRHGNNQSRAERILKVGAETELSLKRQEMIFIKTWMLHIPDASLVTYILTEVKVNQ